MPAFTKSKGALALAFLAVALTTGCSPQANSAGTSNPTAATSTAPANGPCTVVTRIDADNYNGYRVLDFDTDQVVYKVGYGESGIATTPFTQLTPRAQAKMETIRKTLPAHCQ